MPDVEGIPDKVSPVPPRVVKPILKLPSDNQSGNQPPVSYGVYVQANLHAGISGLRMRGGTGVDDVGLFANMATVAFALVPVPLNPGLVLYTTESGPSVRFKYCARVWHRMEIIPDDTAKLSMHGFVQLGAQGAAKVRITIDWNFGGIELPPSQYIEVVEKLNRSSVVMTPHPNKRRMSVIEKPCDKVRGTFPAISISGRDQQAPAYINALDYTYEDKNECIVGITSSGSKDSIQVGSPYLSRISLRYDPLTKALDMCRPK